MLSVFFVAQATVGETKTIYVCLPSVTKNEEPVIFKIQLNDDAQMEKFLKNNGGGMLTIVDDTISPAAEVVQTYDALIDGSTYCFYNGYYNAVLTNKTRAQVEDRVLEAQISSAMMNDISKGAHFSAHVHRNVKFTDEKTKRDVIELDRVVVVHEGGEDVPYSVAYVVECALSPQVKDVKLLLDKVVVFQSHTPSSPHFRSVGMIVPVLGGRMWSEVIQECKAKSKIRVMQGMGPILRIEPSGNDFKVIR